MAVDSYFYSVYLMLFLLVFIRMSWNLNGFYHIKVGFLMD